MPQVVAARKWRGRRIVGETLEPGAVAKVVAARHGIGTGLLFTWRREMLATAMSEFAAVAVVLDPATVAPARADVAPGLLELAFPSGATLRINSAVDPAMLQVVLAQLGRAVASEDVVENPARAGV